MNRNRMQRNGLIIALAGVFFGGMLWAADEKNPISDAEKQAKEAAAQQMKERIEKRERETYEMLYAFRGKVDIYLTAKGADQPAFVGAKMSGQMRVADVLYYYVELADGSTLRLPPSQILMVHLKP